MWVPGMDFAFAKRQKPEIAAGGSPTPSLLNQVSIGRSAGGYADGTSDEVHTEQCTQTCEKAITPLDMERCIADSGEVFSATRSRWPRWGVSEQWNTPDMHFNPTSTSAPQAVVDTVGTATET